MPTSDDDRERDARWSAGSATARRAPTSSPRLSSSRPGLVSAKIATTGSVEEQRARRVSARPAARGTARAAHCGGGSNPAARSASLPRRRRRSPSTNALRLLRVLGALDHGDAVGDRRLRAPPAARSPRSSPSRRVDVGDVDEAGVDRALRELADDALHVRLLGADVGEDRARAALGRQPRRAPRACTRRSGTTPSRRRASTPGRATSASDAIRRASAGTASTSRLPAKTTGCSTRPSSKSSSGSVVFADAKTSGLTPWRICAASSSEPANE